MTPGNTTTLRGVLSGAAALVRQSGSILDIATALCSRSNSAIGFVNQHRVLSVMEGEDTRQERLARDLSLSTFSQLAYLQLPTTASQSIYHFPAGLHARCAESRLELE